ncbi:response regulator transcription factor [Bulleidia sp. zg-1006]|uniref:response regulator transcription factor n=1 Tax=Bulleidia sp. zg-1006 TaxID=2806552 RepID=UPI001939DA87|nr:response regulator transcription factor [Bulleidia sp. zg-1006]QRG87425.1 response regulator transcription factor [Bulleidia sp. zg-1006]
MATILIVDDEEKIRFLIDTYSKHEGYLTVLASNGLEALDQLKNHSIDLVVMDVMMPELDGFSALEQMKAIQPNLPVILLTALGQEYDKVRGFELGVDDYVEKPFSPRILLLRMKAILQRVYGKQLDSYENDGLKIDYQAHKVLLNNQILSLSPKEYDLLVYLIKNKGIALNREQLLRQVWGIDFFGDDRTLDTHMKLLRKNLNGFAKHIVTIRGVGYRYDEEE